MKKPTIALCMIVRDNAPEIEKARKAVESVGSVVDAVYITLNDITPERISKEMVPWGNTSYFQWVDDFAAARNFNFSQAKEDYILWLDADDIIKNPEKIQDLIVRGEKSNVSGFYAKYLYDKDDKGRVTAWHWKIRLLKNDKHGHWAGRIHEDFLQDRQVNWLKQEEFIIDHNSDDKRRTDSVERNFRILAEEVKNQGDTPDPRTLFYLGSAFMQMEDWQAAYDTFNRYLELSGWDEERYEVYQRIGDILEKQKKTEQAKETYLLSMQEQPDMPDAYFNLARLYQSEGDWKKCITWSEMGMSKKTPDSNILVFPQRVTWIPLTVYGYALMNDGKLTESVRVLSAALKLAPEEEYIQDLLQRAIHVSNNREMLKWYVKLADYLRKNGQPWKIPALITSIPKHLQDNVITTKLKQDFLPPKKYGDKSIVFFCGLSAEPWSPKSLDRGGIGGSETAVIHLAKRLSKKGYEVTVYNWCDLEDGVYDGVTYKNYWSFETNSKFNTVVFWRTPLWLDSNLDAKKIFIDMHDVPDAAEFTEDRLKNITKIFVKSKYHRDLFPGIADDKFAIVPNGIDLARFEAPEERIPHSAIYSSSPNRGLDILLNLWPKIREKVPDATLRVFYGWNTYYELQKNNPASMKWMRKIQAQVASLKDSGVIDMGRVGQNELATWQKRSDYWLYPTYFPEISCITGMEVQAAGCIPICTDYAALDETVQHGVKVNGDIYDPVIQEKYLEETVRAFSSPFDRDKMSQWAKETYGWDSVTQKWIDIIEQ